MDSSIIEKHDFTTVIPKHVAMSSKNWFGPVKCNLLLDQMTSRNLSTSFVEYVNVLWTWCWVQ
jgi:hypothetical protein